MTPAFTKRAIGNGAMWSVLNQSFGQILVLLVFLVTARFVSKEAFGVMAVCLLVVEAFRQIAIESIGTYIVAKKDPGDKDYNAAFLVIIASGLASAVLIFLLAEPIARFLNNEALAEGLRWISLLLLTTGLSKTHEVWLAKHLKFKVLALRSIVSICIGGGIGIAMAVQGYGLLSLIAQQLITALIGTLTLWLATSWKPGVETHRENIYSLFRYSRHVSMNAIASFVNTQSDVFFSSYYLGAASTGVYSAAKRIITAVNLMLASGLNSVALPVQASLHGDSVRSASAFLKSVALTSLLTAPLFAGLAALSGDVIAILLGNKWAEAAPVLSILTITAYLFTVSLYNSNVLLVYGKPHWLTIMSGINAVANVVMFVLFARYGLISLALAYTVKTLALYPLSIGAALFVLNINYRAYLANLLPSIFAALGMAAVVMWSSGQLAGWSSPARLFLLVPVGALLYLILMLAMQRKLIFEFISILVQMVSKREPEGPKQYVWRQDSGSTVHGGTKAAKDVHAILIDCGWQNYDTTCQGSALRRATCFARQILKLLTMPKTHTFFVQLPQYGFTKKWIVQILLRRFKSIALLHDIDRLRTVSGGTSEKLARVADYLITTGRLHEYLPASENPGKTVRLEIWDYLLNPMKEIRVGRKGQVIFAGSMGPRKSIAIFRAEIRRLPLVLYGTIHNSGQALPGDIYKGPFDSENPQIDIEVAWGLIWEGGRNADNALAGNDYEKINQPHKLSFYLACGIPVIVWNGSFIAQYVSENKCGITVSSLEDIQCAIEKVSETEYAGISRNAKEIGMRLRQGWALKKAMRQLGF